MRLRGKSGAAGPSRLADPAPAVRRDHEMNVGGFPFAADHWRLNYRKSEVDPFERSPWPTYTLRGAPRALSSVNLPPTVSRHRHRGAPRISKMGETTLPGDPTQSDSPPATVVEPGRTAPVPPPALDVTTEPGVRESASHCDPTLATADGAELTAGPSSGIQSLTAADEIPSAGRGRVAPIIPGYQLECELGRGGMGVVYKARQVTLNRTVALKMILAGDHASPEARVRFLAEAQVAAKLQHPGVVQVFHIAQQDRHPYIEMEYVAGGSLADRLDGIPRPPRQAARLIEGLARAMGEAHRLGIVHRDLKPGNILMTPDGDGKIADFGLAKLLYADSGLTATESILGSPSYMAPEQAEGKTREAGPAADVYALGAILYEQLIGRPPFRGATLIETLQQVKTAEPVPPSRLVPGLPPDVETIALKCLQKDPKKRYAVVKKPVPRLFRLPLSS
jgi:tRNA A-37 threonylcarbamoyl transferase component Bud32